MRGHSHSKNGVASLAYLAHPCSILVGATLSGFRKLMVSMDHRVKPGDDRH
jgi:hypothetical protein